jgi:hypothetical protein
MAFDIDDIIFNGYLIKPDGVLSPDVVALGSAAATPVAPPTSPTPPTPTQTLSGFAINAAGTQLTFANSGAALTALAGSITVAGASRALTFVNATTASFTPVVTTGQVVTVTLTSTTPAIPVAVTNVAVANNSTAT